MEILILFFLDVPPSTEIYSLSLHDALPISPGIDPVTVVINGEYFANNASVIFQYDTIPAVVTNGTQLTARSEEHTSELQSRLHLVCRLLLEKKNKRKVKFIMKVQKQSSVYP